jgi:hypothetical protein
MSSAPLAAQPAEGVRPFYFNTSEHLLRISQEKASEHVKENFLMTANVKRWLLLFQILNGNKTAALP